MTIPETNPAQSPRPPLRLWPAGVVVVLAVIATVVVRLRGETTFQQKNMTSMGIALGAFALLLIWWAAFSRARWRLRVGVLLGLGGVLGLGAAMFRVRGVSGDLMPILAPRWERSVRATPLPIEPIAALPAVDAAVGRPDFPQFLGPDRTGVIAGPALDPDWAARAPREIWRRKVGPGWSGFAIAGQRAITQEQDGPRELVVCYDLASGRPLWSHGDTARYDNPIGGEGPRATPTIVGDRVFTFGSTGRLNALDLATGRVLWTRDLITDTGATMPEWGYAGSPLVLDGRVIVSAGGKADQSLIALRADTGSRVWAAGTAAAGYGAPFLATLAGRRQILAFNHRRITAHDAADGAVLWEYPWGRGNPHVAVPVIAGDNRVVFSAGYGVGSELLEIKAAPGGGLAAERVWQSLKLKAKLANPVARDGFIYGLDDGMLTCLDLRDGAQKWKEGRHGHGQGLLVGDLFLLMAEDGELILLRPTPAGPGELRRHRVFSSKTWNPIALAGDLLVVRNDLEAVCLRLPLANAVH
ncbi:MAG: PQQ-like beta-propeller repeat protein [Opitutaceae bacterium]|nr:PQQ-like beta-propeller repeat protein [Opitutaceae bacterium]